MLAFWNKKRKTLGNQRGFTLIELMTWWPSSVSSRRGLWRGYPRRAHAVNIEMRTDSSMGKARPNYLGASVPRDREVGGMSIVSSALAAHNHFLRGGPLCSASVPGVLSRSSGLSGGGRRRDELRPYSPGTAGCARASTRATPSAAREDRPRAGRRRREAVRDGCFLGDPAHRLDLWLERGQIQSSTTARLHGRTNYVDHDDPARHRHLVRLWLRAGDRRHFRG